MRRYLGFLATGLAYPKAHVDLRNRLAGAKSIKEVNHIMVLRETESHGA